MKELEIKIKNLTFITILGFVILGVLVVGLYFKNTSKTTTTESSNSSELTAEEEYDAIAVNFTSVTKEEALELFDKEGTYVLYIGRNNCSVCQSYVSELKTAQDDLEIKINYYDLNTSENFRTELADLAAKFTGKQTVYGVEDTIGNLFIAEGYTPTTVIIKDGKFVDGFIGYEDADALVELISEYL